MDLATLQSTISGALSGSTFDLPGSAIGPASEPVPALFAALFAAPALQLSGASVDAAGAQPVARGTLAGAPGSPYGFLAGMGVVATFRLDAANTPQAVLTFTPAAGGYGLPDAFPDLKNSIFAAFAWSSAQFTFDSSAPAALPAAFPTNYGYPANSAAGLGPAQTGAIFQATVAYAGADPGMKWLLGAAPAPLAGPIDWHAGRPRLDLASAPLGTRPLRPFAMPVSLHLVSLLLEVPADETAGAQVLPMSLAILAGTLGLPAASPAVPLPFGIEIFSDPPGQVAVVARCAQAGSLALDDIAALLGVPSLASQQPAAGFPALSGLALQTVTLCVDPARSELLLASAAVSFTPPGGTWVPFGGSLLTFQGLVVTFTVIDPASSVSFSTEIAATAGLAGGTLEAQVSLPGLDFCCDLADGSPPIDLTALVNGATGGAFGDSFQILCPQLKVLGNPAQNYYRLQATVSGDNTWGFHALGTNFALGSVGFDLTILPAGGGGTTGQVVAQIVLGGAPVSISAAYLGAGAGWTFNGGTVGVQAISLSALVDDALTLFGLSLPAGAPAIVVTSLQMMLATATMDFGFSCDGTVAILGADADIGVDLGRTHDDPANPGAVTITFAGYLTIAGQTFAADFTSGAAGSAVKFVWQNDGQPLGFESIASFFGFELPALPEDLDLGLVSAEFFSDFAGGTVVASAQSVHFGQILFASLVTPPASPDPGQRVYLFQLDVPLGISFSDLPVAGDQFPAGAQIGIRDLQVIVASHPLAAVDLAAFNALLTGLGDTTLIPASLAGGLTFATLLELGSTPLPVVVPLTGGAASPSANAVSAAPGDAPAYQAGAKWFPVGKTFGPVQLQRIGLQYQDGTLFFLLDISVVFSGLALALDGLGVGSPLTKFSPRPHLDGLAVSFQSGPVAIDGGLLVLPENLLPAGVTSEYLGAVTVAIDPWLISGTASYASIAATPARGASTSLFVFAQVTGNFGGPPSFFITGFMAGFGYNSQLALPAADEVSAFPFLAGFDDPALFGANPTPIDVLNVLSGATGLPPVVTPAVGKNWIAAGVIFRSFELVLGRALVVATFGDGFEVALLGLASASLPQGATTDAYAYMELQLEVIFKPDDGYFGLSASLTANSFVITKDCHLTGGFAFCLWFGPNPHAGDFVVTVGGYHPAFVVPAWYPTPAPVGFNWQVDGDVTIKGGAYFALTPSAIMAGGSLEVLFESGPVRAWFTAYANLLIRWKPFHFTAGIGISIGASVRVHLIFTTVTLSFELGATLDLWGPPTGGVAHVHLYIVSFSVSFGSGDGGDAMPPLGWTDFQALLPPASAPASAPRALSAAAPSAAVLGVQVNGGLRRQTAAPGPWIVRADEFVFTSSTAIPATAIGFGAGNGVPPLAAGASALVPPATISIRPMGLSGVTSAHTVTLTSIDEKKPVDLTKWTQAPQAANLPEALWGAPLAADATPAPSSATIPGLPTGVRLIAPAAGALGPVGPMNIAGLVDPLGGGYQPLIPAAQADPIPPPVADPAIIATIASTLASPAAQQAQTGLIAALTALEAAPPTSALLTRLAGQAGQSFSQDPLRAA